MTLTEKTTGTFYGIGVGTGDPELLTVKAINALKKIDVLIAPKTEKKDDSVALSIAQPYLKSDAQIVYQTFPMVKDFADDNEVLAVFESNRDEILQLLRSGKDVGFATIGDPMFYSTYIYIFRLLKDSGVNVETIAGVPAFLAIASQIGRPLVFGNDIITIIPATANLDAINHALDNSDATVIMKVYKNFPEIVDALKSRNMLDDAVLVSRAGLDDEKIITDIAAHKDDSLNYLSTILTRRSHD
ncbi:MAG: precorrin-2 C(20)-methyltransferase [Selenomonadaceae bacterium]|nr:precorrin-2 C(20)-methyltransferase [Selenomonadaceae bacterium]